MPRSNVDSFTLVDKLTAVGTWTLYTRFAPRARTWVELMSECRSYKGLGLLDVSFTEEELPVEVRKIDSVEIDLSERRVSRKTGFICTCRSMLTISMLPKPTRTRFFTRMISSVSEVCDMRSDSPLTKFTADTACTNDKNLGMTNLLERFLAQKGLGVSGSSCGDHDYTTTRILSYNPGKQVYQVWWSISRTSCLRGGHLLKSEIVLGSWGRAAAIEEGRTSIRARKRISCRDQPGLCAFIPEVRGSADIID